jgi:segregation and condensation protein A
MPPKVIMMTVVLDQPFQILLGLVQDHKIDPWDVDIGKLAEVFIKHIKEMEELDLRVSGRTVLSASVLLRMKSDYVLNENGNGNVAEEELQDVLDIGLPELGPVMLIHQSPRKITIAALLGALQEALQDEPNIKHPIRRGLEKIMRVLSEYDINIEKYLEKMYHRITELANDGHNVTFSELITEKTRIAVARTLLLLLLLCGQKKVALAQDDLFGEIFVFLVKPAGA